MTKSKSFIAGLHQHYISIRQKMADQQQAGQTISVIACDPATHGLVTDGSGDQMLVYEVVTMAEGQQVPEGARTTTTLVTWLDGSTTAELTTMQTPAQLQRSKPHQDVKNESVYDFPEPSSKTRWRGDADDDEDFEGDGEEDDEYDDDESIENATLITNANQLNNNNSSGTNNNNHDRLQPISTNRRSASDQASTTRPINVHEHEHEHERQQRQRQQAFRRLSSASRPKLSSSSSSLAPIIVLPQQGARYSNNKRHSLQMLITLVTYIVILTKTLLSGITDGVVVHQFRFIENKTGRSDYALEGESVELSCHYMMQDEQEDVKQIIWSKDGANFLRWTKNKPGLEVLNYTFKGHLDNSSINNRLIIHNVTIAMHGKYNCHIKTDLGVHGMEHDVIIISQSYCKLNDWRISSEQTKCRETFKLDCRNMFPRPVPSCGLWNDKINKFIRSVTVDISEEPNKETYRVRYLDIFDLPKPRQQRQQQQHQYKQQQHQPQTNSSINNQSNLVNVVVGDAGSSNAADLLQYAGHLSFKCDILVPETSWRLSLEYKMFDHSDGCLQDPLETIDRMRSNYSQFAASRMQQAAGYLIGGGASYDSVSSMSGRNKLEYDLEMLASSLKYDLISPASIANKDSKSIIDLNCWHKPKPGTLARLSCNRDGHNNNKHAKLIGTNLLECRSDGQWHPVTLQNSNNNNPDNNDINTNHNAHNTQDGHKTVGRKLARKFRSEVQQTLKENDNDSEKQRQQDKLNADDHHSIGDHLDKNDIINQNHHEHDDDDDSDDSTLIGDKNRVAEATKTTVAIAISVASSTEATVATSDVNLSKTHKDHRLGNIPTNNKQIPNDQQQQQQLSYNETTYEPVVIQPIDISNLTPAQLAALLPNCVSTITRKPYRKEQQQHLGSRLTPAQDEAVVLEAYFGTRSSSNGHHQPSSKYQVDGSGPYDNWRWMTIFSSSSSSALATTAIDVTQRSLIISLSSIVAFKLMQ